ncbi:MAG: neutral zinc metallopeptidase [Blastococcus sp.]
MKVLLRRALPLAVTCLLLGACANTAVVGVASPGPGEPVDVSAQAFPITGVSSTPIDQFARNALTDLNTFWARAYPEFFHGAFTPLAGGYFSVDSKHPDRAAYPATGIGCTRSPASPDSVAGNAFYDPGCDSIAYDRSLLQELSTDYGRFLVAVVMAHEFGHAMQGRFGFAASGRSIQDETQADCLAGAWTRWVDDGKAAHVSMRTPELDDVVRGFLLLRDQVGSDPADTQAHGSYFDRVSAYYEGFEGGVASCRDDFGPGRVYTAAAFTSGEDFVNQGNAPYSDIVNWIDITLPLFWKAVFPHAFGKPFTPPTIRAFDSTAPDCPGLGGRNRDLGYCAPDTTVYYDRTDLIRPAYDKLGDFAVAAGLSVPYALAARSQAHLSVDDGAATRSAVCVTGWYTHQWYTHAFAGTLDVTLSPGDVDEAVEFMLTYGRDPRVFPNVSATGFQLVGAFRDGFVTGGAACGIGR